MKKFPIDKEKKEKKNNEGFTLIELLIGITILGIIVIPFLHAFVTTGRTNEKAKRMLRATTVAENVMEEINSLEYSDIVAGLSNTDPSKAISTAVNADSFTELTSRANSEGTKRVFAVLGVQEDTSKYDLEITLDSTSYYKDNDSDPNKYNDELLVNISNIRLDSDVLYSIDTSEDNKIATKFVDRNTTFKGGVSSLTAKDFLNILSRTITIDVVKTGTTVDVNLTLRYECPVGYVSNADRVYERTTRIARKDMVTDPLSNIYILYYPNYSSVSGSIKDTFVINNTDKVPCDIYLVKQVSGTASDIMSKELYYVPEVRLNEKTYWGDEKVQSTAFIHSNFCYNLGKKEMGLRDYTMTDKANYIYNGLSKSETDRYMVKMGLLNEVARTRIYHTTVKVYKSGGFDSTNEVFNEDRYILKIDN